MLWKADASGVSFAFGHSPNVYEDTFFGIRKLEATRQIGRNISPMG